MKMDNIVSSGILPDRKSTEGNHSFTSVERSLRPLLISMKLAGMYFDPTPEKTPGDDAGAEKKTLWILSCITCRVYCYSVMVLVWFNFIRCVVGLFPSDEGLSFQIVITVWYFQCAINSTIMMASCERVKHLRTFYKHWDWLFKCVVTQEMGCSFRCPLRYLKAAIAVGWGLIVLNTSTIAIFLFDDRLVYRDVRVNILRPFPDKQWLAILETIIHLFATAACVFPVMFLIGIARMICVQFFRFRSCLSKQIDAADDSVPDRLSEFRVRYTQLCKTIEIINGTFKWILGVSFILQISLACLTSYLMINKPPEIVSLAFWFCSCVLCIPVLAISSSNVHDAAHSLLDDVLRIGTKNATADQLAQLQLFLTKLTRTSVGFTAIDFFVITKEFLLTLGGLYITYFFLLLQFKIA